MTGDQGNVPVCQKGEGCPFREYPAYQGVVLLHMGFLPGSLRVAIEDMCPSGSVFPEFQIVRSLELYAVIRKDDREEPPEHCRSQAVRQKVEGVPDTLLTPVGEQEDKHKIRLSEDEGEQHLLSAPSGSFDGIHLDDIQRRVFLHISPEAVDRSSFSVFVFQFCRHFLRVADPVAYLLGKIDIPEGEDVQIDIVIERLLTQTDFFPVRCEDVIDRLAFPDKRSYDRIDPLEIFRRGVYTLTGRGKSLPVFPVGRSGGIVGVDLLTLLFFRAAVTHVGRGFQSGAEGGVELIAQCLTVILLTELTAVLTGVIVLCGTEVPFQTAPVSGTAVGREPVIVSGICPMVSYFPGYRRQRPSQSSGDKRESQIVIQILFNEDPVVQ